MYSSSSGPRSKSATHGAGTSPAIRDAATNGNARAAYPGTYSNLNAYTAPTVVASTASSRSTTQSARLRPTPRPPLEQRDSILRASILDTALELGVGTSSAVDKWMFGPIGEADEETDEINLSPGLTYASTATSDESWLHSSTSSSSQRSTGLRPGIAADPGQRVVQFAPQQSLPAHDRDTSLDSYDIPTRADLQTEKRQGKKLRKARPQDGYVSDGGDGYTSEGGDSKPKAKKNKKEKKEKGEDSDGGYLSDILGRRRRNKDKDKDKTKKTKSDALNLGTDAEGDAEETDGGHMSGASSFARSKQTSASKVKSKTKSKLNPGDSNSFPSPQSGAEDSDGGYLSSSSVSKKRRFFRLKRSDTDDTSRSSKESIPPVPALPKLALSSPSGEPIQPRSFTPLPIADRFASRSNTPLPRSETPSSSLSWDISGSYAGSSRATTPISPATRASEFSENDRLQDRDRLALPLPSPNPSMTSLESLRLTHAFKDAESVRTPSIDVLRAFGRQAGLNMRDEDVKTYLASRGVDRMKDENSSLASTSYGSLRDAAQAGALRNGVGGTYTARERSDSGATEHEATRPDTSTLDLPSPGLKIKRTLSKKRTPTPLISVGSAATSSKRMDVRSYEALKGHAGNEQRAFNIGGDDASIASTVRHDEDGYEADLTVDVTPATPSSGRSRLTESSVEPPPRSRSPSPSLSQASGVARPAALGKYDIPPPSPPPLGPLPQVPPSPSSTPSSIPSSASSPTSSPRQKSLAPAPLTLDLPQGKRLRPAPPSPLSKSSFTQDDVQVPKLGPSPSPNKLHFLSRKLSKRPGTAPASPGPGTGSFDSPTKLDSAEPETSPSASPSSNSSRFFGFGRNRAPSRPGTAPSGSSPTTPPTSFNASAAAASGGASPLALKRVTSNSSVASMASTIQRGRESPFPARPVLVTTPLMNRSPSRSVSPIQPIMDRQPMSAGLQRTISRTDAEQSPGSAQTLDVKWQPRATSPLAGARTNGTQSPYLQARAKDDDLFDDSSSWVDFDDSPPPSEAGRDSVYSRNLKRISTAADKRQSVASYESQPDIDSVLETLNGPSNDRSAYERESKYSYRDDERSMYPDEDDEDMRDRETAYYTSVSAFASDAEEIPTKNHPLPRRSSALLSKQPVSRYSTSPSPCPSEFDDDTDDVDDRKSRTSILDQKRSGNVREKLVKRVERMRNESESRARI